MGAYRGFDWIARHCRAEVAPKMFRTEYPAIWWSFSTALPMPTAWDVRPMVVVTAVFHARLLPFGLAGPLPPQPPAATTTRVPAAESLRHRRDSRVHLRFISRASVRCDDHQFVVGVLSRPKMDLVGAAEALI